MNLLKIIRKNQKLEAKRNPAFESNRVAKFMMGFMAVYFAAIALFLGFTLPLMFEELVPAMEAYHIMNQGFLYVLAFDFLIRFTLPPLSREIKPYLLMPIKRNRLMGAFVLQCALNGFNLIWMFVYVPFACLTILRFFGFMGVLLYLVGIWLLFVLNSLWFQFCRMLIEEKAWWYLLPLAVYGGLACVEFLLPGLRVSRFTMELGEGFILGEVWAFALVLAGIVLLSMASIAMQKRIVYNELARVKDTQVKHLTQYGFLDRFGEIGEYLRLDLKLQTRNKMPRKMFISALLITVMFSCVTAFTEVYDGKMTYFIVIYNYAIFGIMSLGNIMSFEGNYLDGLMSRKESIYNLLCAKYYLSCFMLLIPFLFMLTMIVQNKMSWLMSLSYLTFTGGFVYAMLLTLAVFNNRTLPLNESVMKSTKTSTLPQTIITLCAFGLPLLFQAVSGVLFGTNTTFIIMLVIGLGFMLTHRRWIKYIYRLFMKRRYSNMEGFRATR